MLKISVVVPVYNAVNDVRNCLESLKRNFDFTRGEVLIIDDCSEEETAEYLKHQAAGNPELFTLRRNENNLGFVKTCNRGIAEAKGEIVILLNSDTMIPAGFCDKVAACFDADPLIAVASPIASYSGTYFIPLRDGDTLESMNERLEQIRTPAYPAIPTAEGFCFCMRRHLIEKYGALDEIYGKGYNEERDFSFRMVSNGLRCALIDDLYVFHKRHASFGKAERKKQLEQNDRIFKERWGSLIKEEKKHIRHHNPITQLRIQMQPEYFSKNPFYSKASLPDKTVLRILGIKITLKKKNRN